MTLGQYSKLANLIIDARRDGSVTPEDAEVMLKHITDDDPIGKARLWQAIAIAAAAVGAIALAVFA